MKDEIKEFVAAREALKVAEKNLHKALPPGWSSWSISDIQDLIDEMPRGFSFLRKMYEVILRKDEEEDEEDEED